MLMNGYSIENLQEHSFKNFFSKEKKSIRDKNVPEYSGVYNEMCGFSYWVPFWFRGAGNVGGWLVKQHNCNGGSIMGLY